MKQKTAMMRLYDQLIREKMRLNLSDEWKYCYESMEELIQYYLEKEKEQIMEAYDKGMYSSLQHSRTPRQYYNSTYKQD